MDWTTVGNEALELIKGIVLEPRNLYILIPVWVVNEFVGLPLLWDWVKLWVERAPNAVEKVWRGKTARNTKRTAIVLMCLGASFVPFAQPAMCVGVDTEACQTIMERLTVASVLGGFLILVHAKVLRRLTGGRKRKGPAGPEVTLS